MKVIALYLPVPHRGYKELFGRHPDAIAIFVFPDDLIEEFRHLRKDLSSLAPDEVVAGINAMNWVNKPVRLLGHNTRMVLNMTGTTIVMPNQDISEAVVEKYLYECDIVYDNYFLRWDKFATTAKNDVVPDCVISESEFDREVMGCLMELKEQSSDFWRQVAGAVVKDQKVLCSAYNTHVPDPENPYIYSDPRFNFSRGIEIDLATGEHAERRLISLCAKKGIAMHGTDLYVTTFPCPPCAKAVATSGIAKLYFKEGYGSLDSEGVLRAVGIELIRVQ